MDKRRLIIKIIYSSLIVLAFIVSVGFASHKQSVMPCSGVKITINDSSGTGFVEESDILQTIQDKFGSLNGKPLSSINISLLEKIINTNPFIYDAEVFSTVDGKINIDVKQRIPVLRVINYKNENFYVDREGVFMPLSDKFTARVPVANGYIFDLEAGKKVRVFNQMVTPDSSVKKTKIEQLFEIVKYTSQSDFWNAEVQQLYVNDQGDIEMIPRVGNHSVIIGDDNLLDEKFNKLLLFYREGLNKKGWDKYSTINLKYRDQVVCTKK
jgi:cell division protein FtsQ